MSDRRVYSRRQVLTGVAGVGLLAGCSTDDDTSSPTGTTPSIQPPIDRTTASRPSTTVARPPVTAQRSPTTAARTATGRRNRDVPFRETPQRTLRLDLYTPADSGSHPFVVFAHGGGWITGDKGTRPMFQALTEAGIAVVDVQYRLAQEQQYPAAVRDVTAAVKWVRANAGAHGIDPERGALAGYSAGAHLAALVGLAPDHSNFQPEGFHPEVPADVDAIVGYSGPYDFTAPEAEGNPLVSAFFGADASASTLREGSPVTHVDGDDPPTMLVHGTEDSIVPYRSTTVLANRLREAGVPVEVVTGDGAGHGMIDNPRWRERTLPAQRSFLETSLELS